MDEILIFALMIALVESIAQNTIKTSRTAGVLTMGLMAYMIVGYMLHFAYAKYPISRMNTVWSSLSIVIAMLLGYYVYGEKQSKWSVFSFALALTAILVQTLHKPE